MYTIDKINIIVHYQGCNNFTWTVCVVCVRSHPFSGFSLEMMMIILKSFSGMITTYKLKMIKKMYFFW